MRVISKYLGTELEFADRLIFSGGEEVSIIPQSELEEIVFNNELCIANNVQVHYSNVLANEPGHYAFICSISDSKGRRVEKIGESTFATLDTEIARNYPTLMAFKRAFGAAAISFLGLRRADGGALYTDQQIQEDSACRPVQPDDDFVPPFDEEPVSDIPQPEPSKRMPHDTAKKAAPSFGAPPLEEPETPTEETPAPPVDAGPATLEDAIPAPESPSYGAPPIDSDGVDLAGDTAAEMQPSEIPDSAGDGSMEPDIFDTTILAVGKFKNNRYSIRQAYKQDPKSINWVAYELNARSDFQKQQQRICQQFLEKYGKDVK